MRCSHLSINSNIWRSARYFPSASNGHRRDSSRIPDAPATVWASRPGSRRGTRSTNKLCRGTTAQTPARCAPQTWSCPPRRSRSALPSVIHRVTDGRLPPPAGGRQNWSNRTEGCSSAPCRPSQQLTAVRLSAAVHLWNTDANTGTRDLTGGSSLVPRVGVSSDRRWGGQRAAVDVDFQGDHCCAVADSRVGDPGKSC